VPQAIGGNVNGLIFAVAAGMLLLMARGRWLLAGVALGITFAIKPVLPALLLIFILRKRYLASAIALAVPLALSLPALFLNSGATGFITHAVPFLASGNDPNLLPYNVALAAMTDSLHVPSLVVLALRISVFCLIAMLIYLRWRQAGDESLLLAEVASLLLLGSFLCFSFSWRAYSIYLIPLLVSIVHPQALIRQSLAWLGVYFIFAPDTWLFREAPDLVNATILMLPTFGYLLILAALGDGIFRRAHSHERAIPTGHSMPGSHTAPRS
jgi:arabinofuranan 3-O-arabinosyltransferase